MQARVVGAGSWGTALSIVLARNGHQVDLAAHSEDVATELRSHRENRRYLPGFAFPDGVHPVGPAGECPHDLTIIAVPTPAVRGILQGLRDPDIICLASKGLDPESGDVLSDVLARIHPNAKAVALSGPNLAVELAQGTPTAAVAASAYPEAADLVRRAFNGPTYRVYAAEDIRGVELAGALKNVIAIGAGICDGLGFGDNTKAAFVCRGLAEMTKIGLKNGARIETFLGLAGVGDLFATASSRLSRNYRVGLAVAAGNSVEEAVESLGQVAEGVGTLAAALRMADRLGIEVPLMRVLDDVLYGRVGFKDGIARLMERDTRFELNPFDS